ncbi:MAG TPA: amidohydrolase family protein [Steroidobacteraceae bacterium]|nr:amidohydrolase family protein [Steroidobacteraceae bacterium]
MPPKSSLVSRIRGLLLAVVLPGALSAADLQIEHVTVVSPERVIPMRNALVRVHDGRIVAISRADGATAQSRRDTIVMDGSGLFLTPGLIDSHVHLGAIPGMTPEQEVEHPDIARAAREQIPRSFLLYGFTTLVDLVSTPQELARWKGHDIVPDTYFCGGAALMDGYAMNYAPKPQRYEWWPYMLIEPGTQAPDGIDPAMHTPQTVVSRMKADGAICVKTFFERGFGGVQDLPVPKLETIREVVKAAHAAGMPVLMHANSDEAQRFGLDAGVDIMAHGLWNWNQQRSTSTELTPAIRKILDDELAQNVGWQPTIQVLYGIRDLLDTSYLSDPRLSRVLPSNLLEWYRSPEGQWFRVVLSQEMKLPADASPSQLEGVFKNFASAVDRVKNATTYLVARHGRVLFATDTPSAPTYANPPGLNGWLEMHRLIDAGETPAQIFKSATLTNARALKLDRDIGTVQVGKRANLLLLRQDPTQTIDAYAGIEKVILNGRVLDPSELAANAAHGNGD